MKGATNVARRRRKRTVTLAANDKDRRDGPDRGTPEQIKKRALLVKGGDINMASCPLDVYLERGMLDQDQHNAAWRYAFLYGKLVGRTSVRSRLVDIQDWVLDDTADDLQARYEHAYRSAVALLSVKDKSVVDRVSVFHDPVVSARWTRDMPRLQRALTDLARHFGITRGNTTSCENKTKTILDIASKV